MFVLSLYQSNSNRPGQWLYIIMYVVRLLSYPNKNKPIQIVSELQITILLNNGSASSQQQNTIWIEDKPFLQAWLCHRA